MALPRSDGAVFSSPPARLGLRWGWLGKGSSILDCLDVFGASWLAWLQTSGVVEQGCQKPSVVVWVEDQGEGFPVSIKKSDVDREFLSQASSSKDQLKWDDHWRDVCGSRAAISFHSPFDNLFAGYSSFLLSVVVIHDVDICSILRKHYRL